MSERILVVEDEIGLQETLVYNLQHQGYQVDSVGDGNDAVRIARQVKPDLILRISYFEMAEAMANSIATFIRFIKSRKPGE